MSQLILQSGLEMLPSSSLSVKDFQEALKEFNLEIIEEVRKAKRSIFSEFLGQSMTTKEAKLFVFQRVNYKMEEIVVGEEERRSADMEELQIANGIEEELTISTISQNECLGELEKGKIQVYYSKKFSIMDAFSNLDWDLFDGEMEKHLKELSLKVLRKKESAFLFNLLNLKVLRRKAAFLFHVMKKILRRKDFAFLFDFLKFQLTGGFFYFDVG